MEDHLELAKKAAKNPLSQLNNALIVVAEELRLIRKQLRHFLQLQEKSENETQSR